MRVLVINPNSSQGVTARIAAAAQAAAGPGERVLTVAAEGAPELIVTPEDTAMAEGAVMAAVARHGEGVDGIVLASFGDTGIARVRAQVRVPVLGIARAGLAVASAVGERFAMVTFAPQMVPALHQTIRDAGHEGRLAGMHTVEGWNWSSPGAIQDDLFEPLRALCMKAAQGPGVGSIVLGGGPLAGLAARLQPYVPVPMIDGTSAALGLLRMVRRVPAASA